MSKDDINSLGSLYGGMLNELKRNLIKEGNVGPGEIGDADLQDGGPQEEGGYAKAAVDVEELSDKEKEDNLYNINKLSYTKDYIPEEDEEDEGVGEDPMYGAIRNTVEHMMELSGDSAREVFDTALEQIAETLWQYKEYDIENPRGDGIALSLKQSVDRGMPLDEAQQQLEDNLYSYRFEKIFGGSEESEEDEESSQISEKIARDSLNNFMKQKSTFDKFYDKVMVSENFDEMESEDFDALGLDDATPDDELEGGDEVTISVPRDVAQTLCDLLQGAMGEGDLEDGDEFGGEEEGGGFGGDMPEEDEEGIDTGSTMSTKYDDGKSNKVGDLSPAGAATAKGANIKLDAGSNQSTSYKDGKSNKVGSLTKGKRIFDK